MIATNNGISQDQAMWVSNFMDFNCEYSVLVLLLVAPEVRRGRGIVTQNEINSDRYETHSFEN